MGYFIGVSWLFCAFSCIFTKNKENEFSIMHKCRKYFSGFFAFFGICSIMGQGLKNEFLLLTGLLLAIGLLCMWCFVYSLMQSKSCTCEIEAIYTSYNAYYSKGVSSNSPVFDYYYEGVQYSKQAVECYSLKKLNKLFKLNQAYIIFINPNFPEFCISTRKINRGYTFCGVLGVFFTVLYFLAII